MITLDDIRDYVAGLGIAEDSYCYCGKMPEKKEKSIGSYPLKKQTSESNTDRWYEKCIIYDKSYFFFGALEQNTIRK